MDELLPHYARAMMRIDSLATALDGVADDRDMSEHDLRRHLRYSATILRRITEAGYRLQEAYSGRPDGGTTQSSRQAVPIVLFPGRPVDDDGPNAA